MREAKEAIQRTLILTLGDAGEAVGQRLAQVLEMWDSPPVVAVLHLEGGGRAAPDAIEAGLREISRLAHRATLHELGHRPDRLDELVVWTVGAPDAPLAETVSLATERAVSLLGLEPLTLGMVIFDVSDPTLPVERDCGPGAAFTGPCYLLAQVNEAGLALDDAPALYRQAARFIALHTCTALRDAPLWMEQAGGWDAETGYASFGLTWPAWPGETARARAARRLALDLPPLLTGAGREARDETAHADALLREAALAPPNLITRLTPPAAVEAARLSSDDLPPLTPWAMLRPANGDEADHPLLANLDALLEERVAGLDRCKPTWECLTQEGMGEGGALARSWAAQALDTGGPTWARALGEELARRLGEWAAGVEQRQAECQADLSRLEEEAGSAREALVSTLAQMPSRSPKELIFLLCSPLRWPGTWVRWRKIQDLHARYVQSRAAALEMRLNAEQTVRACGIYWGMGSDLQTISQGLDRLERNLGDLFECTEELPAWPDSPLVVGSDPDALLDQLADRYLPAPGAQAETLLAELGPLSTWWRDGLPARETISGWLAEQARPLAAISIWDVARCRHERPDAVAAWVEELIAQASPLWRWDAAAFSDAERARSGTTTALLAPPDEGGLLENTANLRLLPLPWPDQLAVVTLRWGIPGSKGDT